MNEEFAVEEKKEEVVENVGCEQNSKKARGRNVLLKAIRDKCLECVEDSIIRNVEKCENNTCALWNFRLGKNPFRKKKELTEEQKKQMVERMLLGRERKRQENAKMNQETETFGAE